MLECWSAGTELQSGRGREAQKAARLELLIGREMVVQIRSAKDLVVYQKAYALAMEVFRVSKTFPVEERYSLTSQIRRSSRSVSLNLREAWLPARRAADVCGIRD